MMLEIAAALLTTSGWVLVTSTLPTEYWKVYSLAGTVILTTPAYFSNLWKLCITDSTGVSDCKDFPSMLALDGLPLLFSVLFFSLSLSLFWPCVEDVQTSQFKR